MQPSLQSTPSSSPSGKRTLRWAIVGMASVLLHLIMLNWANGNLGQPSLMQAPSNVVQAALHTPTPAALPTPQTPTPARKPKRSPPKPRPAAAMPPPASISAAGSETATEIAPVYGDRGGPELADAGTPAGPGADNQDAQGEARQPVIPPPSAELKYDVQALRDNQTVYGYGKITWQFDGKKYAVQGEAGVRMVFFDVTLIKFVSEGEMDDFGVAPEEYSETRFRRSKVATHFSRKTNLISYSASELNQQRKGGEQDRASILWQLAGLARGNSEKFAPNMEIPIFVAGLRDGEVWNIRVIGEEEIELGIGKTRTWHLSRTPRPGSYDQKLDIWLAPQHQWYPVRIRHTEVNGDYLDMSVSAITTAQ